MKNIKNFINESWQEYEKNAAKHIIDVLSEYIDWENDFDKEDKNFHYWIKFNSKIKKSDLNNIKQKLRTVLASHEIRIGKKLIVNIYKEGQLIIDPENECVYIENAVKSYYNKNIKNK